MEPPLAGGGLMGATLGMRSSAARGGAKERAVSEPLWIRTLLIGLSVVFMSLFLLVPLLAVFYEAFKEGWRTYVAALVDRDAMAAIRMTLLTAAFAVPLNLLFGLAAAWCITKFEFPGKTLLITAIDLPYAVSPVIAGMLFVLLFGRESVMGPWLAQYGIKVAFAAPGVVLATIFVTFPFVARELIPLMHAQGSEEEQAARVLGAAGWPMFWRVTLPNIKWGLLYGVILCNARAMGEFGAVSVICADSRGGTNTMPMHVEALFNGYEYSAAFAMASVLAMLAIVTLVLKTLVEWRSAVSTERAAED
jgi:sulfate transport system permease protein